MLLFSVMELGKKRGHSSLNGVITFIASDSGKCIDNRVLSKICNACTPWESRKDSDAELYENSILVEYFSNNQSFYIFLFSVFSIMFKLYCFAISFWIYFQFF